MSVFYIAYKKCSVRQPEECISEPWIEEHAFVIVSCLRMSVVPEQLLVQSARIMRLRGCHKKTIPPVKPSLYCYTEQRRIFRVFRLHNVYSLGTGCLVLAFLKRRLALL